MSAPLGSGNVLALNAKGARCVGIPVNRGSAKPNTVVGIRADSGSNLNTGHRDHVSTQGVVAPGLQISSFVDISEGSHFPRNFLLLTSFDRKGGHCTQPRKCRRIEHMERLFWPTQPRFDPSTERFDHPVFFDFFQSELMTFMPTEIAFLYYLAFSKFVPRRSLSVVRVFRRSKAAV